MRIEPKIIIEADRLAKELGISFNSSLNLLLEKYKKPDLVKV